MRPGRRELAEQYSQALQEYCDRGGEAALLRAYQVGRRAVGEGLGVLEMAAVHQEALATVVLDRLAREESAQLARRASEFLAEALAPFELTRQGFQELNAALSDLNRGLQRRLDAALQDVETAQDQILQQKRLEELKDEFIGIVSHEVRTPLTSIHGALNLLKNGMGGDLSPQGHQLLDVAYRNSQRLVRFVSDILDLQKIESGAMTFDMRPIEVASFVQQAVDANQAYARQLGVALSLGRLPRRAGVRADADRLMQVMANLLSNAVKFSPPDRPVVVAAGRRGGMIRFSVRDAGPGLPEEFRQRAFQKFAQARTSREKGGSGLGLSISKAIVESMGGRIDFESVVGHGTTFYFDLPQWHPGPPARQGSEPCPADA